MDERRQFSAETRKPTLSPGEGYSVRGMVFLFDDVRGNYRTSSVCSSGAPSACIKQRPQRKSRSFSSWERERLDSVRACTASESGLCLPAAWLFPARNLNAASERGRTPWGEEVALSIPTRVLRMLPMAQAA
ncbi:hypothetical protein MRX96_042253 [Rhipicephalus microplus]